LLQSPLVEFLVPILYSVVGESSVLQAKHAVHLTTHGHSATSAAFPHSRNVFDPEASANELDKSEIIIINNGIPMNYL
jgi:hypothetical protein